MLSKSGRKWTVLSAAVVALFAAALVTWHHLSMREWILAIDSFVAGLGAWGIVFYVLMYVGGVIVLAPGEIMSIAGGLIFGLWGIPLVVVSATIGATSDFLIARYALRAKVREFADGHPVFATVDTAIRDEGWKLVLVLRLNPLVPFNLQNYAFGVTDIGLLPYVAATFFGIMPGTAAYVYLGTLGRVAAEEQPPSALRLASYVVAGLATILLAWIAGRRAKTMLSNISAQKGAD